MVIAVTTTPIVLIMSSVHKQFQLRCDEPILSHMEFDLKGFQFGVENYQNHLSNDLSFVLPVMQVADGDVVGELSDDDVDDSYFVKYERKNGAFDDFGSYLGDCFGDENGDDNDEANGDDDESFFDENGDFDDDGSYFDVDGSYFALLSAGGDDVGELFRESLKDKRPNKFDNFLSVSFGGFCTCSVSIFSITGVSTIDISTGFSLFILIIVDCCCADDGIKVLCSGGRGSKISLIGTSFFFTSVGGPISLAVNSGLSIESAVNKTYLARYCRHPRYTPKAIRATVISVATTPAIIIMSSVHQQFQLRCDDLILSHTDVNNCLADGDVVGELSDDDADDSYFVKYERKNGAFDDFGSYLGDCFGDENGDDNDDNDDDDDDVADSYLDGSLYFVYDDSYLEEDCPYFEDEANGDDDSCLEDDCPYFEDEANGDDDSYLEDDCPYFEDEANGDDDSYLEEDCPYFEDEANGDFDDDGSYFDVDGSYFALLSAGGDDVGELCRESLNDKRPNKFDNFLSVSFSFGGFCTCSVSIFSITGVSTIDISTGFSLFILIIVDCCCADDGIKVLCSGGRDSKISEIGTSFFFTSVGGPISLAVNSGLSIESAVVGISLD
ncbi:hypothetical protein DERP_013766 [Dermatophagoides pteronyssinus]|uniref:Uncharacterized protein n=1 Tax=Dermatophagoides pteronyssinus TaxID=6956 RepID=A0ABQ8JG65_DERPT|nr:hypothetical protein DERP_013766 [Dermatophagoides pteronyssinus]